jgi:hypothetical protein
MAIANRTRAGCLQARRVQLTTAATDQVMLDDPAKALQSALVWHELTDFTAGSR